MARWRLIHGSAWLRLEIADRRGRIAQRAGVKTLVLSHFVPADAPGMTAEKWADAVRPTYKGDLVVAHDLTEIPL